MNNGIIDIGMGQLAFSLLFVALAGAASFVYRLGLGRDLLIGSIRAIAQLLLMGYALTFIFELEYALLVVGVYLFMIVFSTRIIRGRVREKDVNYMLPTLASMLIGYVLVTMYVTGVIIQADPWWKPQYFLPIGGMVIGNSMSALAIALERLFSELRTRRGEVEMRLALGADVNEASHDMYKNALKAGMIPSINSLMGVGVVSIPGMMSGQIVAGADPLMAVRYQIVIMLMIVGATAISSVVVLHLVRKRCFSSGMTLILGHEQR